MVYRIAWYIANFLLRILFGYRVEGAENVPETGPVILAANHLSILDPIAVGSGIRRPVVFMARSEPFKMPILSWLLPRLYVIPVERGTGDLGAIKAAIRVLREGKAFGIFPSGTRGREGKVLPFKTGVAAIAARTGATVVPVGVIGSYEAWPYGRKIYLRRPIKVVFGKPIPVSEQKLDHQALDTLTQQIEAAVIALLPPKYHPDPNLARLKV
ncbi:MAG: 1-acyl-sn-glycerol-3-phosphate acyltransferase [Meiothermus silvanus]|nr:1-acyl-sn-glycerol-3-phosphate acyltransferase [Allomeiothermus silvanus]